MRLVTSKTFDETDHCSATYTVMCYLWNLSMYDYRTKNVLSKLGVQSQFPVVTVWYLPAPIKMVGIFTTVLWMVEIDKAWEKEQKITVYYYFIQSFA